MLPSEIFFQRQSKNNKLQWVLEWDVAFHKKKWGRSPLCLWMPLQNGPSEIDLSWIGMRMSALWPFCDSLFYSFFSFLITRFLLDFPTFFRGAPLEQWDPGHLPSMPLVNSALLVDNYFPRPYTEGNSCPPELPEACTLYYESQHKFGTKMSWSSNNVN